MNIKSNIDENNYSTVENEIADGQSLVERSRNEPKRSDQLFKVYYHLRSILGKKSRIYGYSTIRREDSESIEAEVNDDDENFKHISQQKLVDPYRYPNKIRIS